MYQYKLSGPCYLVVEKSQDILTTSNAEDCFGVLFDSRVLQNFSSLLALTKAKMMKSVWWGCSRDALQISWEAN